MSLENINSTDTDEDDDHDHLDQSAKPAARAAITLLAEAALKAALTSSTGRILKSTAGRVVVVEVPAAVYVGQTGLVLRSLNPTAFLYTVTEKKRKGWSDDDPMPRLSRGQTVLAVTQDPSLLHASIHAAVDLVLKVRPPDVEMVRKVINAVTGGRARDLGDADIAGRDLDQLAAAIRPGSSAVECVSRLKRLGSAAVSGTISGPDLETLPLFGEAKAWSAEVLADLDRLRLGEIVPADLEAVLLYGPPGTGKTLLASAVAKATGLRFFSTSVASWFINSDGHLDGVLKAADAFFQTLLDNAPSLGLLDELEALPDRATLDARHREWWNSVITGVLLMVTRVKESGKPVILIGATNFRDRVDAALMRPGRLGRHVLVRPAETEEEVADLLRFFLADNLETVEVALAASLASGATPAQVEGWVKAARRMAREAKRPLILDDLIAQITPPDRRSEAEILNVARHEAGHAVATLVLGCDLKRVSIVADGTTGGVTTWQARSSTPSLRDIEDQVIVALSGRAADELLGEGPDAGARSDLQMATNLLVAAEANLGLRHTLVFRSDEVGIQHLLRSDADLLRRMDTQLKELMRRASALVLLHRDAIVAIAETLVARRILSGPEVAAILTRVVREQQAAAAEDVNGPTGGRSNNEAESDNPFLGLKG